MRRTLPPYQRRLVTSQLATAGVLLALLIVLVTSQPGLRASLGALVSPPTPTPLPLPFEGDIFFLENSVPWGVLKVDGKQQTVLDVSQYGSNASAQEPISFGLGRGRHAVEYVAPPFATRRCTVSVPVDRRDTCPLAPPDSSDRTFVQGAARVLDVRATPDQLPAGELSALNDAVTKLIAVRAGPASVPAGEQYLAGNGIVTATQPLAATIFREPWNAPSGIPGWNCTYLCAGTLAGASQVAGVWPLVALVREGFTYATPDGQVVIPAAPLSPYPVAGPATTAVGQDQVQVLVTWAAGWKVARASPNDPPLPCVAANTLVSNVKGYGSAGPGVPHYNFLAPIAAANLAEGCVTGLQQVDSATGKPLGQPIYLLYRFGLLLTTDDVGRQLFPALPVATPRERAITQQIVAQRH